MAVDLAERARAVLLGNSAGAWTKPSPAQYPHQWNWDSAFVSLGLATFDPARAMQELESLLRGRWLDGMVPHVRYDARHLADYFPGPDWWPGAAARVFNPGELTSGISNPPVSVVAALEVGKRAEPSAAHAFWERTYEPLRDYVLWFRRHRTQAGSPLPLMVHPWESGWDNSPRWDFLARAGLKPMKPYRRLDTRHVSAEERPTGKDYDSFLALAEIIDAAGYDISEIRRASPFCVHDVLLDAVWFWAARSLGEIAGKLDRPAPVEASELAEYRAAFEETHWDQSASAYLDYDAVAGRRLAVPTAAGLAALAAGLAPLDRAERACRTYLDLTAGLEPVPTAAPGPWFEPARYWRGPVWINVNWLAALGLDAAGLHSEAGQVRARTLELCAESELNEYFDARDGKPLATPRFSWTAALALDLLERKGKPVVTSFPGWGGA